MATDLDFAELVAGRIGDSSEVSYRQMFGAYTLCSKGKVVALLGDNQLFVKITKAGRTFIGEDAVVRIGRSSCVLAPRPRMGVMSNPCREPRGGLIDHSANGPNGFWLDVAKLCGLQRRLDARKDLDDQGGEPYLVFRCKFRVASGAANPRTKERRRLGKSRLPAGDSVDRIVECLAFGRKRIGANLSCQIEKGCDRRDRADHLTDAPEFRDGHCPPDGSFVELRGPPPSPLHQQQWMREGCQIVNALL